MAIPKLETGTARRNESNARRHNAANGSGGFALMGGGTVTDAPEWVIAVTSATIGALAGMLRT